MKTDLNTNTFLIISTIFVLSFGFKATYEKIENLPNYQDLTKKIESLESQNKELQDTLNAEVNYSDSRCTCIPYLTEGFGNYSIPSDTICKSKVRTDTDADRLLE